MKVKIATIYNDICNIKMSVNWNDETKLITYCNLQTGEEWDSDETADTLQDAIDDTYLRYCYGWGLVLEEIEY